MIAKRLQAGEVAPAAKDTAAAPKAKVLSIGGEAPKAKVLSVGAETATQPKTLVLGTEAPAKPKAETKKPEEKSAEAGAKATAATRFSTGSPDRICKKKWVRY